MTPLDELAPNYRRALSYWKDAPTLAAHYLALAQAYEGNGYSLIETTKSYLECVCRTILTDYGAPDIDNATTTELMVAALERLGIRNARGASHFDKVLSAHNKLADALSDARNHDAPIAHGKDGFLDALARHHLHAFLLTGDTILSLLLGAVDRSEPNLIHTREPYDRFPHHNDTIDSATAVDAGIDFDEGVVVLTFRTPALLEGVELRVLPSRLLYQLDRTAYVELLDSAPTNISTPLDREDRPSDGPPPRPPTPTTASTVHAQVVTSYTGRFEHLKVGLAAILDGLGARKALIPPLVESVLATYDDAAALDWETRESTRARVRVALKRVLKVIGPKHPAPDSLAKSLLQWFLEQEHAAKLAARPKRPQRNRTPERAT